MSHYMTALAMKQVGLKPAAKIVLYWLADHHNGETGACFPSLATLSKKCEMDKATVVRHLNKLEKDGVIVRHERRRENGSRTSTGYELRLKQPVAEYDKPCRKTQTTPVANCAAHNLGNNNLGNELLGENFVEGFAGKIPPSKQRNGKAGSASDALSRSIQSAAAMRRNFDDTVF